MAPASTSSSADPRFPIGPSPAPAAVTLDQRSAAIDTLAEFPQQLRNALSGLDHQQIDTPYREGGWTVRQLVHHIADSHTMAVARYRFALTEDWPTIAVYKEAQWAELHDYLAAPPEWSLEIIEATHARWTMLLQSLTDAQWQRGFIHPQRGSLTLEQNLLIYQWHSRHHLAHITHLRHNKGW